MLAAEHSHTKSHVICDSNSKEDLPTAGCAMVYDEALVGLINRSEISSGTLNE